MGCGIAVDRVGNAYVTGTTLSRDFPVRYAVQRSLGDPVGPCDSKDNCTPVYGDAFITRIGAPLSPTPGDPSIPACCGAHFFPQTKHNLSGPFLPFWQRYGGLDTFGYPRTEP